MIEADKLPHNPFWNFSLESYKQPGVAPACLVLQDKHDLDVNLLLFCCWAGLCSRLLSAIELTGMIAGVEAWRDRVIEPLRDVRRWIKQENTQGFRQSEELRQGVKDLELWAEALQQNYMHLQMPLRQSERPSPEIAARNLVVYLELCEVASIGTADCADLAAIVRGGFPELPPLEAVWLFQ
ncbi:TIGR02444 family protein [Kiloniella laminariae]|uniref:TIGR02444 family protein n=1 Tax=Kiloniella laminariae TaxID=454162 RepID=A0ABT4LIS6_9PROT|nr:TIGR02444 family protein [Kiloniella laminariae]MCZ4280845.1 TIGR02444 family protein [Kiloniella laminariae]